MLWVLRSEFGQLQAACEWHLVNEQGTLVKDGCYVWIEQLEVSDGVSLPMVLRHLMRFLMRQCPQAIGGYWQRTDSTGIRVHQFRRGNFQHYAEKGVYV